MKTLLHVGCGFSTIQHLPILFRDGNWDELRYDINEDVHPDIVGTLQDMSLMTDSSFDALFSSHNVEHVFAFEVKSVLSEFRRILKPTGFATILCPDVLSVAQAIVDGKLISPLYISDAGPITAIDVLYGYQADIAAGNIYMAHKTAFSAQSLASDLLSSGFAGCVVARDRVFGLHAIATVEKYSASELATITDGAFPGRDALLEIYHFGCYED